MAPSYALLGGCICIAHKHKLATYKRHQTMAVNLHRYFQRGILIDKRSVDTSFPQPSSLRKENAMFGKTNKSLAVAQYLLSRRLEAGDAVTPMQLIKLAYIAHGVMLGKYGRPLLDEPIEAWQYGPVVRSVYDAVKEKRSQPVARVPGGAEQFEFTPDERRAMDAVARAYGPHNGIKLSTATHMPGTPWSVTWEMAGKNSVISNDLIEDHYSRLLEKNAKGL